MTVSTLIKRSAYPLFFGILIFSCIALSGAQLVHAQSATVSERSVSVTEKGGFFNWVIERFMRSETKQIQKTQTAPTAISAVMDRQAQPVVSPRTVNPAVKSPDMQRRPSPITPTPVKIPVTKPVTPVQVKPVIKVPPVTPTQKPFVAPTPDSRATKAITNQARRPKTRVSYDTSWGVIDPNKSSVCESSSFNKDDYRIVDLRAGTDDNFATPAESAGAYAGTPMYVNHRTVDGQGFAGLNDQSVNNRRVFSFDLSGYENISCAYFYMDLRRLDDPLTSTDSFFVHSFVPGRVGVTPEYCNFSGELACFGTLMTDRDPDFLSGAADQFYTFNLSELVQHDRRPVDLLGAINKNKNLHFGIQDDTAVDYAGVILYIPK